MGRERCTRYLVPDPSLALLLIYIIISTGLVRLRDNLMAQLQELSRAKPRGKADENVVSEITRLESAATVTKDDLVMLVQFIRVAIYSSIDHPNIERDKAATYWVKGRIEAYRARAEEVGTRTPKGRVDAHLP